MPNYNFTPEQRRKAIELSGLDPNKFTVTDTGQIVPTFGLPQASSQPTALDSGMEPRPTETKTSTFLKSFGVNALPSLGGGAGAAGGMMLGGALLPTGIGTIPGAAIMLGSALTGALVGGAVGEKVNEAVIPEDWLANAQASMQQNPGAAFVGRLSALPLGGFMPGPANLVKAAGGATKMLSGMAPTASELANVGNVGIGAAINPAILVGKSLVNGEPMPSVGELATEAAIGAVFNKPNAIGRALGFRDAPQISEPNREFMDVTTRVPQISNDANAALLAKQPDLSALGVSRLDAKQLADLAARQLKGEEIPKTPVQLAKEAPDTGVADFLKVKDQLEGIADTYEQTFGSQLMGERPKIGRKAKTDDIVKYIDGITEYLKRGEDIRTKATEKPSTAPKTAYEQSIIDRIKVDAELPTSPNLLWYKFFRDLGLYKRGYKIQTDATLSNKKTGNEVAGEADLQNQLVKLGKAGTETLPHEATHFFVQALRESKRGRDAQFYKKYESLVESLPEYQQWKLARENAKLTANPEEYIATNAGMQAWERAVETDSYFQRFKKDFGAYTKTRFGKHATEADFRRMMQYKLYHDPAKEGFTGFYPTVKGGENKDALQKQEEGKRQEVLTNNQQEIVVPKQSPVDEPVKEPITKTVTEPITKTVVEPVVEPVIPKPVTEPITEPVIPKPPTNQTAQDVKNAFDALAGGIKEASEKRTMETVAKQGYVEFAKKGSQDMFEKTHPDWSVEIMPDGSKRYRPATKQSQEASIPSHEEIAKKNNLIFKGNQVVPGIKNLEDVPASVLAKYKELYPAKSYSEFTDKAGNRTIHVPSDASEADVLNAFSAPEGKYSNESSIPKGEFEYPLGNIKHPEFGTTEDWWINISAPVIPKINEAIRTGNLKEAQNQVSKLINSWRPDEDITFKELRESSDNLGWDLSDEQIKNDLESADIQRKYFDAKIKPILAKIFPNENIKYSERASIVDYTNANKVFKKVDTLVKELKDEVADDVEGDLIYRQIMKDYDLNSSPAIARYFYDNLKNKTGDVKAWEGFLNVLENELSTNKQTVAKVESVSKPLEPLKVIKGPEEPQQQVTPKAAEVIPQRSEQPTAKELERAQKQQEYADKKEAERAELLKNVPQDKLEAALKAVLNVEKGVKKPERAAAAPAAPETAKPAFVKSTGEVQAKQAVTEKPAAPDYKPKVEYTTEERQANAARSKAEWEEMDTTTDVNALARRKMEEFRQVSDQTREGANRLKDADRARSLEQQYNYLKFRYPEEFRDNRLPLGIKARTENPLYSEEASISQAEYDKNISKRLKELNDESERFGFGNLQKYAIDLAQEWLNNAQPEALESVNKLINIKGHDGPVNGYDVLSSFDEIIKDKISRRSIQRIQPELFDAIKNYRKLNYNDLYEGFAIAKLIESGKRDVREAQEILREWKDNLPEIMKEDHALAMWIDTYVKDGIGHNYLQNTLGLENGISDRIPDDLLYSQESSIPVQKKFTELDKEAVDNTGFANVRRAVNDPEWAEEFARKGAQKAADEDFNEGKYSSSSSFLPFLASRIDKVQDKLPGPEGKMITQELHKFSGETDYLTGQFANGLLDIITAIKPAQVQKVYKYLYDIDDSGSSPVRLNAEEKKVADDIVKLLRVPRQMQIDMKMHVSSKAGMRQAGMKPNGYMFNMLDPEVAYEWANNPTSAKSRAYDDAYKNHRIKHGDTVMEAQEALNEYRAALGSRGGVDVEFGALRKAEGKGLPWMLVDKNFGSAAQRYGRRAAKDLAYFKYIQSNPAMLKALNLKDQEGNYVPAGTLPHIQNVGSHDAVKEAMRSVYGIDTPRNPKIMAAARVAANIVMGPGTAIRNLATMPAFLTAYVRADQAGLLAKAIYNMKFTRDQAFKSNAIKASFADFDAAGAYAGNPDKMINVMDKFSSILRKYQGRDLSNAIEGQFYYSIGELLTQDNIVKAKAGNKDAIEFLDKFSDIVEGGTKGLLARKATADDVSRIAKRFTDRIRGTYGEEGLPSWAIEGELAPFAALGRFSIEKANAIYKDVWVPMKKGNWAPFLKYALGSILTGVGIEKINELLTGKRGVDPTVEEVWAEKNPKNVMAKLVGLGQMASMGGIMSDFAKTAVNAGQGRLNQFSNPLSFPLATMAVDTIANNLADYVKALQDGEDPIDSTANLIKVLTTQSSQTGRYLWNWTGGKEDAQEKEKFRDVRAWKEVTGQPVSDFGSRPNEFANLGQKKFKRETNLKDAAEMLPDLFNKAVEDARVNGVVDPYKLKRNLASLKQNNYQTMPNMQNDPIGFYRYYNYLEKTQGKEAAMKRLQDYVMRNAVNKAKSNMVP